jgi:hypothetical protein
MPIIRSKAHRVRRDLTAFRSNALSIFQRDPTAPDPTAKPIHQIIRRRKERQQRLQILNRQK